jgi:hypothetical protein
MASQYIKSGQALQKLGNWSEANDKTTFSTSGKESWKCAEANDSELKRNENFIYVCVDSSVVLQENLNNKFTCILGKGAMTSVINKDSMDSIFCKTNKQTTAQITDDKKKVSDKTDLSTDIKTNTSAKSKPINLKSKPSPKSKVLTP